MVTVQVSYCMFGHFLDLDDLPAILSVRRNDTRNVATITLDVPDMSGEVDIVDFSGSVWLIPVLPSADDGTRFNWSGTVAPPHRLRGLLKPPWGPPPPVRMGSEWQR